MWLSQPGPTCYDYLPMDYETQSQDLDRRSAKEPLPLWRGFTHNLRYAARVVVFRSVDEDDFAAAPRHLVVLALADLALNLAISFVLAGGEGVFAVTSINSFFFHIPLFLLCGLLAGRLLARPGPITALPVAFVSTSLLLELLHGVLEGAAQLRWLRLPDWLLDAPHYYRFFSWWGASAAFFLVRLVGAPLKRRFALVVIFLVLVFIPLWLFPRGDLWMAAGGEREELHLTEEVLDVQPRLMEEQLSRLLPARSGVIDLYFVGFAGDGSQDVFMRELSSVERLFTERLGAAGRTITLVNNPDTALKRPFATSFNLERTLKRVGQVMNREEDVLFLYLTSHGTSEGELTVENGALELDQITPEDLRRLLSEAGIKWRVIAVSSCFSGQFVDPLKNDHTLIMTASDADHESFGCENGADFTWFGKAYFDEALRTTRSFTGAFQLAKEKIREREKKEGETASNPQIFVGKAMEGKLAELEKELTVVRRGRSGNSSDDGQVLNP